ncbi:DUF3021 domain-containing protein [Bittarella massiliensis (ex Durand et al. 2017)]|uniref:DUF3021 domain-containing protein n=1 Tax=Bittarella massiliensis (ex Durand et al. 2017) TaxID=1720313 RepID=UPI001AA11EF7|nr:DUF3021 domain-containing protein [Bittarella massiliensis (ex Durand et al. 2017)]
MEVEIKLQPGLAEPRAVIHLRFKKGGRGPLFPAGTWPASKSGWACERGGVLCKPCKKSGCPGRRRLWLGGLHLHRHLPLHLPGGGGILAGDPRAVGGLGGDLLAAVGLQLLTSGLLGAVCAAISVFFEVERWSLARQTALHGCCCTAAVIGTAAVNRWVALSAAGLASYLVVFLGIYLVLWLALAHHWRQKLRAINQGLKGL